MFFKGADTGLFILIVVFSALHNGQMECCWVSNGRSPESEATTLPTVPQPLPEKVTLIGVSTTMGQADIKQF